MKKRMVLLAALLVAGLLALTFAACGDDGGGGVSARQIDPKYRGNYNGNIRDNAAEAGNSVVIGSNFIRYTDNSYSITGASTSGGGIKSIGPTTYSWDYLYQGSVKIGVIFEYGVDVPGWSGKEVQYYLGQRLCNGTPKVQIKLSFGTDIVTDDMSTDYSGFGRDAASSR